MDEPKPVIQINEQINPVVLIALVVSVLFGITILTDLFKKTLIASGIRLGERMQIDLIVGLIAIAAPLLILRHWKLPATLIV